MTGVTANGRHGTEQVGAARRDDDRGCAEANPVKAMDTSGRGESAHLPVQLRPTKSRISDRNLEAGMAVAIALIAFAALIWTLAQDLNAMGGN